MKRNPDGTFIPGYSASPETQFKKGQHWRQKQPYWDKEWLVLEYKKKSASDIARNWGVGENAILYWLKKHDISTRSISESRKIKRWGSSGKANPMYGKRGSRGSKLEGWYNAATSTRIFQV